MKPTSNEYPLYYRPYVDALEEGGLIEILRAQQDVLSTMVASLTDEGALYRYAEGKWSIKEFLGHIIDCERVFSYRAMSFARGEQQALPGFDENAYIASASFDARPLESIVAEFISVRNATITLLDSMSSEELHRSGIANGNPITVRALLWIIAGHAEHHLKRITELQNYRITELLSY